MRRGALHQHFIGNITDDLDSLRRDLRVYRSELCQCNHHKPVNAAKNNAQHTIALSELPTCLSQPANDCAERRGQERERPSALE